MLDNERAVIGDNKPPAFDPEVLKAHQETADKFLEAHKAWAGLAKIETEIQASQLTDHIDGLRGLWKKVDASRKAEKKPHDDAGKAVQTAFTPLLAKIKKSADDLKPKLADFAEEKERIEQQKKDEAAAIARKEAEAAEKLRQEAEAANDVSAQVDAEERAKAAEVAAKEASKPVKTAIKSASGAGRSMSMRTVKEVEVGNYNALYLRYRERPEVQELLHRLATAEVRAAGYDHTADPVPGIEIKTRKVMA